LTGIRASRLIAAPKATAHLATGPPVRRVAAKVRPAIGKVRRVIVSRDRRAAMIAVPDRPAAPVARVARAIGRNNSGRRRKRRQRLPFLWTSKFPSFRTKKCSKE
jgi:hypothetical protein